MVSINQVILKVNREMHVGLRVKCDFFSIVLKTAVYMDKFWQNLLISNFMTIYSAVLRLLQVCGTDRQVVSAQGCRLCLHGRAQLNLEL